MITSREKPKSGSSENEYEVTIDNGDLKLIDSLVKSYGFKDRDSLIKFGIATLLQGNNNEGIYTIKPTEDGKKMLSKITPPTDMLVSK
jgi:Arc/MetJ-type ribon-helix-helix transcriptional regulator